MRNTARLLFVAMLAGSLAGTPAVAVDPPTGLGCAAQYVLDVTAQGPVWTGTMRGGPLVAPQAGTTETRLKCWLQRDTSDPGLGQHTVFAAETVASGPVANYMGPLQFDAPLASTLYLCTRLTWSVGAVTSAFTFDADARVPGVQCQRQAGVILDGLNVCETVSAPGGESLEAQPCNSMRTSDPGNPCYYTGANDITDPQTRAIWNGVVLIGPLLIPGAVEIQVTCWLTRESAPDSPIVGGSASCGSPTSVVACLRPTGAWMEFSDSAFVCSRVDWRLSNNDWSTEATDRDPSVPGAQCGATRN